MLIGLNGAGKSTFCEAMMIALNGSNPHNTSWSEKSSFWQDEWSIRLFDGEPRATVFERNTSTPQWYFQEKLVTKPKYTLTLARCALWIQSEHLRVISGEPSERRGFLDDMLASADSNYYRILKQYKTANAQRNKIIRDIQEWLLHRRDLSAWNILLAQSAVQLIIQRRALFNWIAHIPDSALHLPGEIRITLIERHALESPTVENFLKLLKEFEDRDVVVGKTTVWPQLDDIKFEVFIEDDWKPTKYILSRGENKTLLLSFIKKIGMYIESISGKSPLFLLDDVLSELDEVHIKSLLEIFEKNHTIITTQPNHTGKATEGLKRIEW